MLPPGCGLVSGKLRRRATHPTKVIRGNLPNIINSATVVPPHYESDARWSTSILSAWQQIAQMFSLKLLSAPSPHTKIGDHAVILEQNCTAFRIFADRYYL